MSPLSLQILQTIGSAPTGRLSSPELQSLLSRPKSTVAHALRAMELAGVVEKRSFGMDARIKHLAITSLGRQMLADQPENGKK